MSASVRLCESAVRVIARHTIQRQCDERFAASDCGWLVTPAPLHRSSAPLVLHALPSTKPLASPSPVLEDELERVTELLPPGLTLGGLYFAHTTTESIRDENALTSATIRETTGHSLQRLARTSSECVLLVLVASVQRSTSGAVVDANESIWIARISSSQIVSITPVDAPSESLSVTDARQRLAESHLYVRLSTAKPFPANSSSSFRSKTRLVVGSNLGGGRVCVSETSDTRPIEWPGRAETTSGNSAFPLVHAALMRDLSAGQTSASEASARDRSGEPTRLLAADVLALFPVDGCSRGTVLRVMREALRRQERRTVRLKSALLSPYHVAPYAIPFALTIVLPNGDETTGAAAGVRREVLANFGLDTDRPLLRRQFKLEIGAKTRTLDVDSVRRTRTSRLRDVHLPLQDPQLPGAVVSCIEGSFEYYHYGQDNARDEGWGCAYRSLQTIASWLQFQQFTDQSPPTHRQIQETLVRAGDKPSKFVGSREWIGALEVSLCLDELYSVSCRILNVQSGRELAHRGGELAHHFRTECTPVMIGGGVLAYTLLGVAHDETTGAVRFLILDPHYTGAERLDVVREKWCHWYPATLFRTDAFYNLCCPIRPRRV